ncbi:hypothetical protein HNR34_003379 [Geobacillus subterraneus]
MAKIVAGKPFAMAKYWKYDLFSRTKNAAGKAA